MHKGDDIIKITYIYMYMICALRCMFLFIIYLRLEICNVDINLFAKGSDVYCIFEVCDGFSVTFNVVDALLPRCITGFDKCLAVTGCGWGCGGRWGGGGGGVEGGGGDGEGGCLNIRWLFM